MIQMPFALAPPYMVVRSWAVALLFAFFAIVPVLLTAIFRNRIGRMGGVFSLTACVLGLSLAAIRLRELMDYRNALAYWTTHCAALFLLSAIGALVLLRRKGGSD